MKYRNHWAIQFVLYAPYFTLKNKRDILKRKMKLVPPYFEDSYKEALVVSYGNKQEQKHRYKDLGIYGNPSKKRNLF